VIFKNLLLFPPVTDMHCTCAEGIIVFSYFYAAMFGKNEEQVRCLLGNESGFDKVYSI